MLKVIPIHKISSNHLIDTAPSQLNTLNELATALNDDGNFEITIIHTIATKQPLYKIRVRWDQRFLVIMIIA